MLSTLVSRCAKHGAACPIIICHSEADHWLFRLYRLDKTKDSLTRALLFWRHYSVYQAASDSNHVGIPMNTFGRW